MLSTYQRTIFRDEKSGFCIFAYRTDDKTVPQEARDPRARGKGVQFTATGYFLPPSNSVQVDLCGDWAESKFGLQYQVKSYTEVLPTSRDGVLGYLSSGLIKGIGTKTAHAIVDRFGTSALDVLENHPAELLKIPGISPNRLERIVASHQENRALRELVSYLAPFGISANKCSKIQQAFGKQALTTVRRDPFQLCKVPGFGFRTVDEIARKLHCAPNAPMRLRAALLYQMQEAGGNTYLPRDTLLEQAWEVLRQGTPLAAPGMKELTTALYDLIEFSDHRVATYRPADLEHVDLAYAMTIHKSQGSEYATVIIPLLSGQYIMLRRNLLYTGITRAKQKVILVGQKQALYTAIHRTDEAQRNSTLKLRLRRLFPEQKNPNEQKDLSDEADDTIFA